MATISQQLTELVNQKNALAENLTTKGITASSSETLNTLVPKVLEIQGGGGDNKFSQLVDRSITTVTAEDLGDITSIGRYAFYLCTFLTTVTIPDTVTSIRDYAFYYCSSLQTVNLSTNSQLQIIEDSTFAYCTALKSITIPGGVTSIGSQSFNQCTALRTVDFGSNSQLETIGSYAFGYCRLITTITIPETVTSIGNSAFYSSTSLQTVDFGTNSQLQTIGYDAFLGCTSLTTITIPEKVTSIGRQAFYNCSNLQTVIYKGQAPNIQSGCFQNCTLITKYDFRNCTTVPTLASASSLGHAAGCQIIIPDALYDDWTTATNWVSLTGVTFVKASEYTE